MPNASIARTPGVRPSGAHVREHRSILAAAEKRLLVWMAHRMPSTVNSDHLSALALVSMLAAGAAFAAARLTPWSPLVVVVALAVNWFGDSLDGTLARVRDQQRPRYGFYVDHVIDLAGIMFLLTGLALSGYMTPSLALALLAAYLLVSAESYLATHAVGVFRISFLGWGPTELRIVLAVGVLCVHRSPWVSVGPLGQVRLFDAGGVVALAGLVLAFVVSAARNTRRLYVTDPRPTGREESAA